MPVVWAASELSSTIKTRAAWPFVVPGFTAGNPRLQPSEQAQKIWGLYTCIIAYARRFVGTEPYIYRSGPSPKTATH